MNMPKTPMIIALLIILACCRAASQSPENIITTDIPHFWQAYDLITSTQDSVLQYKYLDSLYLDKATPGLTAIREARNYTPQDYIRVINEYPEFWASIRVNTLKADLFSTQLEAGIEKLRAIYPDLKPAKIYFTIGALRTNGTTLDSLVLIGSELAMSDSNTVSSEFPEEWRENRRKFFGSNPITDLVLLNVHEYVHTQQKPALDNLLSYVIREGVAEFVSSKAMDVASAVPAIAYGKKNEDVRKKFEKEMFYGHNIYQWLWGDAENDFGIRDLGYYIGYEMCELYYEQANDKKAAIKKLIELDYTNETEIEDFVNGTGFFSLPIEELYQQFQDRRPFVTGIQPFENNSKLVEPGVLQMTVTFSEAMNQESRSFDFGPLGEEAVVRIKNIVGYSADGRSLTFEIEPLEPNKQYQLTIGWGFINLDNVPLKQYLIDFKTASK